jgi:hypothetical protein
MNNDNALPRKKMRLLGNILLVLASLGLIAGLVIFPLNFSLSSPVKAPEEVLRMMDEIILEVDPDLEGISADMTVLELLERERVFLEKNRGLYRGLSALSAVFMILFAIIFLRLALAWRRADPFGRVTIIGLRCLGALLVVQFLVGSIVDAFIPYAAHRALFLETDLFEEPIMFLTGGGPALSSGILFLILSWVLDYGRRIKEEQSLTI